MDLMAEAIQEAMLEIFDTKANEINAYKQFYQTHLMNIQNRAEVLSKLQPLRKRFTEVRPQTLPIETNAQTSLLYDVEVVLKRYFTESLWKEYDKAKFPLPTDNRLKRRDENTIMGSLINGMNELKYQATMEWNHKKDFLNYLNSCLSDFGLHKNIQKRDPEIYKKFNFIVYHSLKNRTNNNFYKLGLTYKEIEEQLIIKYKARKPLLFAGVLLPFKNVTEVKITTTLLKADEIKLFALKTGFRWDEGNKNEIAFITKCMDETEKYLPYPYEIDSVNHLDQTQVKKVKTLLQAYPESLKLYSAAIDKFEKGIHQRNTLDDLRLALELLLKGIFKNQKSLENQIADVGALQKQKGKSTEITGMFTKLLDYYAKYQNSYVKHNDQVKDGEIEFIIELTSSFMKFIIKK